MAKPLVSIITGSIPSRLDLLIEAMCNIREQSYPNLEHCIAIEGEPGNVEAAVTRARLETVPMTRFVSTRVVGLGRHWSSFLAASASAVPFMVAQWMARGDLLMWLADDERMEPDHIEALVDLLERTESDFVYSRCRLIYHPDLGDRPGGIIGSDPPYKGAITNALFRAELLDYRGFMTHVGSGTDWDQIEHWIQAGARWAMLDRGTISHRVDKIGEGPDYIAVRRQLRGHRAPHGQEMLTR